MSSARLINYGDHSSRFFYSSGTVEIPVPLEYVLVHARRNVPQSLIIWAIYISRIRLQNLDNIIFRSRPVLSLVPLFFYMFASDYSVNSGQVPASRQKFFVPSSILNLRHVWLRFDFLRPTKASRFLQRSAKAMHATSVQTVIGVHFGIRYLEGCVVAPAERFSSSQQCPALLAQSGGNSFEVLIHGTIWSYLLVILS